VVTHRVGQLLESGLVVEGDLGVSTGGRAPRELRFDANAGMLVAAELGATSISVAVCDLAGVPLSEMDQVADIADGPQPVLTRVVAMARELIGRLPQRSVWGVGVGLPGPVEFASGQPVAPPIMPGWDGYPVRDLLAEAFDAPVWVDNDVNVMALGEHRAGIAQGERDFIYCQVGSGIGAGVVSNGQLTRGAQGCAGDIGHIAVLQQPMVTCRCGRTGRLEAVAGGAALQREGLEATRCGCVCAGDAVQRRRRRDGLPQTSVWPGTTQRPRPRGEPAVRREPPVGIEPTTFSLRVRRSTD
jgi:predicted NBD/HSP70 family sugar kinase